MASVTAGPAVVATALVFTTPEKDILMPDDYAIYQGFLASYSTISSIARK